MKLKLRAIKIKLRVILFLIIVVSTIASGLFILQLISAVSLYPAYSESKSSMVKIDDKNYTKITDLYKQNLPDIKENGNLGRQDPFAAY